MSYTGHYPHNRKSGDVMLEGNDVQGVPDWCKPGRLVCKAAGWTAMKVLHVRACKIHRFVAVVCYGPDDERDDVTEERAIDTLKPWNPRAVCKYGSDRQWRCFWPNAYEDPQTFAYTCDEQTAKEMNKMARKNDLYTWTEGDKTWFGKFLTENSDGNWVMEVATSKEIVVIEKDKAEKVMPYTVQVYNYSSTQRVHMTAKKGSVEVGDFILHQSADGDHPPSLLVVTKIDTKNEGQNLAALKGAKMVTTPIE